GCTVVLKGAGTLVAAPGRTPCVIAAGNPGMATGGMGDLLTGAIAAMRAQGLHAFEAACAGALLHALAGDAAARAGQRGLLPSDLAPWLRRLANPETR
ncbi:MAG: bifunctional ADP-dependent NAD(P)H-hydrate dehydratase/NAD(P)H-hydrate epimerase, partial [Xanthomonadales bacterium]|nr:bifunctional ADP-dependent NAD(P)H-hydrate dehydratase/NAD(P)H-hydrate epimerase [Xanthomonadales bacterium]